jgi:signal recognition particle GTPase
VGLGEAVEDLELFDPERFAENLLAEAPAVAS